MNQTRFHSHQIQIYFSGLNNGNHVAGDVVVHLDGVTIGYDKNH